MNGTRWRGNSQKVVVAAMTAAMLLSAVGCERPDWENPDYVAQMLKEGDARQKREAVATLRSFPEDRRSEIAEALSDIYLSDEELREEVMQHLIQWREPGATAAYVEEMRTDATDNAEFAGEALGLIESRESIPAMLEVFAETRTDARRDGILRGLIAMPDPRVVDISLEVLALDVDNHKIAMHSHTCELLGELALEHPEAITDEVINALIRAVFLSDEVGRMIAGECRLAIQKIGPRAVDGLTTLFHEENEEVERLLMTYEQSTENYQYPFNRAKFEATVLLTSMRAPEAVELFMEDLAEEKTPPEGYSTGRRISWIRQEGAAINEMILGLGELGDRRARPLLERVLRGDQIGKEWDKVTDDMVDFQFRQDAARALTRLGDRQARGALMRMTRADIVPTMARRFALEAAQAEENPAVQVTPEREKYRPQWQAAAAFAYLGEASDREAYQSLVDGQEEGGFKEALESFLPAFDVMDECEAKEDDGERAACFGEFVDAEEEAARLKAVYELSRMGEVAAEEIAEAIKTEDLVTREVVTFAGYRAPSQALATNLEAIVEDQASRSAADYRLDTIRLQMLHAWLQNHDANPVVAEE